MSLRRSMIFSLGGLPPLDEVGTTSSTNLIALGLRRLSRSYTGNALEVRNSNNAIGTLAFDSNDEVSTSSIVTITTAGSSGFNVSSQHTLSAFASNGTGEVRVRTWYDQSGNARHLVQSTTTTQPYLMQSGSFNLIDGKPSVYFPNMPGNGGTLRITGSFAGTFYNAVNNRGPLNIVKFSSNAVYVSSSGVQMFGSFNLKTDSSLYGTDCDSTAGFYGFGMANNSAVPNVANLKLGITTRTTPNYSETCTTPNEFPACPIPSSSTARSIIPIGSGVSSSNILDGSGGKIVSTTDELFNSSVKTFLNGTLNQTTGYQCNLIRHPMYNSGSAFFFVGVNNVLAPQLFISFQELISFDGTNSYSERNTVEKNMGRYYNIIVA